MDNGWSPRFNYNHMGANQYLIPMADYGGSGGTTLGVYDAGIDDPWIHSKARWLSRVGPVPP